MKTDLINRTLKWLDHNRYTVISLILFAVFAGVLFTTSGCQSQTASLLPDSQGELKDVTRSEFTRQAVEGQKDLAVQRVKLDAEIAAFNEEVKAFNERVESGLDDLDRQDQIRQEFLDTVGLVTTEAMQGGINPVSLIPLGIGLLGASLGLGSSADNRRKDKVIGELKGQRASG